VRLIPRFDNLVLSHADRSRILGDVPPSRIVTNNGIVHATISSTGSWRERVAQGRVASSRSHRWLGAPAALKDEVERLETFVE
jgi:hypothetical protein